MSKKATFTDTTPFDEHKEQSIDELSESIGGDHAKVYPRDTFWAIKQLIGLHGKVAADANALSTDAKKIATESVDHIDNTLAAITDAAGDSAAPEVIAGRTSATGQTYKTLGQRINADTSVNTNKDDSIIFGKPVSDINKSTLDGVIAGLDQSKFNMLFICDTHYATQSKLDDMAPGYGVDHLNNALYLDGAVDVIVVGGDNIDGHNNLYQGLVSDQSQFATELLYGSDGNSDKFALKGNHDNGSWRQTAFAAGTLPYPETMPETISAAQFRSDYQNSALNFGEVRDGDSNYFYKDYPDKKVRLIGLDSNDVPGSVNDDGSLKYPDIHFMGYRQDQLDWVANTALQNVPADYVVIFVVHENADPTPDDDTGFDDATLMHHTNQEQMNQIIRDFVAGASSIVANSTADFVVNVKTDFTAQGPRVVAGWIHGHDHKENSSTKNGFLNVGIINSFGPSWRYGDNGANDGWNIVTIDPANKKLILTGFGTATDRTFDYEVTTA